MDEGKGYAIHVLSLIVQGEQQRGLQARLEECKNVLANLQISTGVSIVYFRMTMAYLALRMRCSSSSGYFPWPYSISWSCSISNSIQHWHCPIPAHVSRISSLASPSGSCSI